jgi:hypothetical protein
MASGRFGAGIVAVLAMTAALIVVGGSPAPVEAAVMCPPVTIDDLFPPGKTPRRPTTPSTVPGSTTTTSTSTTTSTTVGDGSTTTIPAGSSSSIPTPPKPGKCTPFEYQLVWPILGRSGVNDTFGEDRDHGARHHEGTDIHAPKLTPVVAVADGTVTKVTQEIGTENCCSLVIRHTDGWQSVYVHLNNDHYGTDDGLGAGVRPDLVVGTKVEAGEIIGWVGDSGNAEETVDHLHFELRSPSGVAVDPAASLRRALRNAEFPDADPAWPYLDNTGRAAQWVAATMLTEGLFLPCDESRLNFCPGDVADPEFVRDIARHLGGGEPPLLEGRSQEVQVFEPLGDEQRVIDELMGCTALEPCMQIGVTETDLAKVAAWALNRVPDAAIQNPEVVTGLDQLEIYPAAGDAEAQLRASGLLETCRPPLDDQELVTRESALISLVRWVLGPPLECGMMSQLKR